MKWMILVLVALFVLYIVRSKKQSTVKPPPPPSVGVSEVMLRCAQCGVYLPASESVSDATGVVYCSDEHRRLHPTG